MSSRISNQFFMNYLIVFALSVLAALFTLLLMSFAGDVLSKTLMRNNYPASHIMKDDYRQIDPSGVVENGGGVQVIGKNYKVLYSTGIDTLGKTNLTTQEFTDFLTQSRSLGIPYHYDIAYNEKGAFWLVVTFPTSLRIDFSFAYNEEYISKDMQNVAGALIAIVLFYLLLLALFTAVFSRITAVRITTPLRKLCEGVKRMREGDFSARVDLHLKNEFAELQHTFNDMAAKIDYETGRRIQSEDDRRKLILDISHDLKNPLTGISGYTERCLNKPGLSDEERNGYLRIIYENSLRADRLLSSMFELSKLDSPDFKLDVEKTDVCEYLRGVCAELLPSLEQAGFGYDIDLPDKPHYAMLDSGQMSRVFHNLADNAIRYNGEATVLKISLCEEKDKGRLIILFSDNGIGIPEDIASDIFKPFVRVDRSRNSASGGTGLGLSIVSKIIEAHGGTISLDTDMKQGCTFKITLPLI
jgi:signal transduction histidine kinase